MLVAGRSTFRPPGVKAGLVPGGDLAPGRLPTFTLFETLFCGGLFTALPSIRFDEGASAKVEVACLGEVFHRDEAEALRRLAAGWECEPCRSGSCPPRMVFPPGGLQQLLQGPTVRNREDVDLESSQYDGSGLFVVDEVSEGRPDVPRGTSTSLWICSTWNIHTNPIPWTAGLVRRGCAASAESAAPLLLHRRSC